MNPRADVAPVDETWIVDLDQQAPARGGGQEAAAVRVGRAGDGRVVVVDDAGRATGDIVTVDDSGHGHVGGFDPSVVGRVIAGGKEDDTEGEHQGTANGSGDSGAGGRNPGGSGGLVGQVNRPDDSTAGSTGTGGPGVGLLGVLGGVAGGVGAVVARRRRGVARVDIPWSATHEQSLVLLAGPDSPREHVFDVDVPEGGQVVQRGDGGVDVVDASGRVVSQVDAPWAYDALGRPVETYYTVDPDGRLVQHVDPGHETVFPVIADPDRKDVGGDSKPKPQPGKQDKPAKQDKQDKPAKQEPGKQDKPAKQDKQDKPAKQEPGKQDKPAKQDKQDKPAKQEPGKQDKPAKPAQTTKLQPVKQDKPVNKDKAAKQEPGKQDKPANRDKADNKDKAAKQDRTAKQEPGKQDKPANRDKADNKDKAGKQENPGNRDKSDNKDKPAKQDRTAKQEPGKQDKPSNRDKSDNKDKAGKQDRTDQQDKSGRDDQVKYPGVPSDHPRDNPNVEVNPVTGQRSFPLPDGNSLTEHPRNDGSGRSDWTQDSADRTKSTPVASLQWDKDGNPINIDTIDEMETPLPQQDRKDWANRTPTAQGNNVDYRPRNRGDGYFEDPSQGTENKGHYNEEKDQRSFEVAPGVHLVDHPNRGEGTSDWTLDDDSRGQAVVGDVGWNEDGSPTGIEVDEDSWVPAPPRGEGGVPWENATASQDIHDGVFTDDQGRWINGMAQVDGVDTPVYRLPDGTKVFGVDGDDGEQHWVHQDGDRLADVRELGWDERGYPVIRAEDEFVDADQYGHKGEVKGPSWGNSDLGLGIASAVDGAGWGAVGASADAEARAGRGVSEVSKSAVKTAKWAGRTTGAGGAAAGAYLDIQDGMDPTEAVVTNTAGGLAGAGAASGAAFVLTAMAASPAAVVVVPAVFGAAVGLGVTKVGQQIWNGRANDD
ncbi:hypothetical protein LH390_11315 [Corynebacterium uberis]|uniref:cell envelope integrity protein TolA n=1 Tax=Corynebacterium uberis TaxID=2883169 RepID=UPI001D0B5866|nr:cell envelope integrity protein TolA [Corynebacterium uberis]UDL84627.1 hypothetical protein LH390_11315 [Corynebacterium uberis]